MLKMKRRERGLKYWKNFIKIENLATTEFSSVQLLSCVQLFATPWTAAHQASLSITSSQSSLKLMSIESVMPSNHLILCRPLLLLPSIFPSIRVFSNDSALRISGQSFGVSASTSVLPTTEWASIKMTMVLLICHSISLLIEN